MSYIQRVELRLKSNKNEKGEVIFITEKSTSVGEMYIPNLETLKVDLQKVRYFYSDDKCEGCESIDDSNEFFNLPNNYQDLSVKFEDVTEQELLGSDPIKMQNLQDSKHGMWANIGKRKLKVSFETDNKSEFLFPDKSQSSSVKLLFDKIDGKEFSANLNSIETSVGILRKSEDIQKGKETNTIAVLILNTDDLDCVFSEDYSKREFVTLGGYIEVKIDYKDGVNFYRYPTEICVINTRKDTFNRYNSDNRYVSIDFGTSSTCVAIDAQTVNGKNYELLTISSSSDEENVNEYENPTNLMVYNWKELYQEWSDCENIPVVHKGNLNEYKDSVKAQIQGENICFDFGYTVKELFADTETTRQELNAILTCLKMIPSKIKEEYEQLQLRSYKVSDENFINIVTDPDEQNEERFDPVAFYGFLIGRSINDYSKREVIYTNYKLTSPIGFSDEIKNSIVKSLEFGLKKSLPKTLKDNIKVTMDYSEPVAYIGAICGTDYLSVEDKEEKLFAVYDFGGGTLDFSFGSVYSDEDEDILRIHIYRTGKGTYGNGSNNIGGEKIIEILAYRVYCENHEHMNEKRIPIEIPHGEAKPDDISDSLLEHGAMSSYAKANLNILSNQIIRPFFEGRGLPEKSNEYTLYDENGKEQKIQPSFDDKLEEDLQTIINQTIKQFRTEMEEAFKNKQNFDIKEVNIFKSGNSSRSKVVEEELKAAFPENKILLVDETSNGEENNNKRYAITPKTAVAIGQLRLGGNGFEVMIEDPFQYYVGYFSKGTGKFKKWLSPDTEKNKWTKTRAVNENSLRIYYSVNKPEKESDTQSKILDNISEEQTGEYIYFRVTGKNSFEYIVSKDMPAEDVKGISVSLD